MEEASYIPPPPEKVLSSLDNWEKCIHSQEVDPLIRLAIVHAQFEIIHPYMDGNGRIGRFLMNVMLAAGGFSWTVIPHDKRDEYMDALENGSVRQNIEPFAIFLGRLVSDCL